VSVCEPSLEFHALEEFTYIAECKDSTLASKQFSKVKMDLPESCVGCYGCNLGEGSGCGGPTLVYSPYTRGGRLRRSLFYQPVSVA
jgi:hypothetical protein